MAVSFAEKTVRLKQELELVKDGTAALMSRPADAGPFLDRTFGEVLGDHSDTIRDLRFRIVVREDTGADPTDADWKVYFGELAV